MHSDEVLGNWIPLVDYSFKTGTSLSTLRRHIKSNKILYRLEEGRYLIYDPNASAARLTSQVSTDAAPETSTAEKASHLQERQIQILETELQRAHEELTELKMLLAIYEEKIGST
ncbi:MAG: hypothetical protein KA715_02620 [Xanthomonadaceae bacterium]|nr:hypothetical protein [Xanthomonadaceae bacterium]